MYRREILICACRYKCVYYLFISSMYNLRTAGRRCKLWRWRPRKRGDTRARAYVLSLIPSYVQMHPERRNWGYDFWRMLQREDASGWHCRRLVHVNPCIVFVWCVCVCEYEYVFTLWSVRVCVYAYTYTHIHTLHITHTHNNENVGDSRG